MSKLINLIGICFPNLEYLSLIGNPLCPTLVMASPTDGSLFDLQARSKKINFIINGVHHQQQQQQQHSVDLDRDKGKSSFFEQNMVEHKFYDTSNGSSSGGSGKSSKHASAHPTTTATTTTQATYSQQTEFAYQKYR